MTIGSPPPADGHESWLRLHREHRERGAFLGENWGSDEYVDEVVRRFCLPHLDPDGRALEIGPGGGRYTERLLPHVGDLHVVDVVQEIVDDLDERLSYPPHLRTFVCNGRSLADLPLAKNGYDFVCSFNLFLFLDLENVYSYLADLRALLAPTGLAVIQYADFSSPGGKAYFHDHLGDWNGAHKPFGRFSYFTKEFLEELLRILGFTAVFNVEYGRDSFVGFTHSEGLGRAHHEAIARTVARSPRSQISPAGLDDEERAWWQAHAELESEVCWVQSPAHRRLLRDATVAEIVESVPAGGTVVDFGCGTGWLCELLAEFGAKSVVGIDESAAQIALARRALASSPRAGAIRYVVGHDIPDQLRADVVVCHAILHHLSWDEIRRLVARVRRCLKPGGTLWLLEPVLGSRPQGPWGILPGAVWELFSTWNGARHQSDEEKRLRRQLAVSRTGARRPGHGPSPKEIPFRSGELEAALSRDFELVMVEPALLNAHHVAAEQILFAKTFPRLGAALATPALWLASRWERLSFRFCPKELWKGWVFCLFRFRRR
ncbi:MAG: methyltransferase domain-containing protein [Planctomycetes bacterium]|nr:methyltransferase domain-containing protein [Planctomycetota bacterium]